MSVPRDGDNRRASVMGNRVTMDGNSAAAHILVALKS
jgi:hypothetical protein